MIPAMIDGEQAVISIPDVFDTLNYHSYRAARDRGIGAERCAVMYVSLGIGSLEDTARWEAKYQEEATRWA